MVARFVATGVLALVGGLFGVEPALAQQRPSGPSPVATCPVLFGPRAGAFGPNSLATVAGVVQPGVCWLELSLAFGFGAGEFLGFNHYPYNDGIDPLDFYAEATYLSFTVPLGARFWFMNTHSLLADAGFGFTRYLMKADVETQYGPTDETWNRLTTALVWYVGAGYGYRPEGAQAGPRFAAVVGAFVHATELGESTMLGSFHPSDVEELKRILDGQSDQLAELEPYVELSASWMF